MKKLTRLSIIAVFMLLSVWQARAYTWYVDGSNAPPGEGSLANPYTTIALAADALAATNAIEGTNGGHVISVNAVTVPYAGFTNIYTNLISLGATHQGAAGNPNVLITTNLAKLSTSTTAIYPLILNNADNFTVDGFDVVARVSGGNYYGFQLKNGQNNTIRNCNFYALYQNLPSSVSSMDANSTSIIENCTFYGSLRSCLSVGANSYTLMIRNCIIVNNVYGINLNTNNTMLVLQNNNIFANGRFGVGVNVTVTVAGDRYNTEAEINGLPNCSGNIARVPGFSDLANNWNFNSFYADSPCLGSGVGGVNMGAHQNPTLVALSTNTYYVATTGDDSLTTTQAQNPGTPWKTISNAAAYAIAGNTVVITNGAYAVPIPITITHVGSYTQPVIYKAATNSTVTISAASTFRLILNRVGNVVLDGISMSGGAWQGFYLSYSHACTIKNATYAKCTNQGLKFYKSHQNILDNMLVISNTGSYSGIYLSSSSATIKNCTFRNNAYGIQALLYQSGYVVVQNCNFYNNTIGVVPTQIESIGNCYVVNCTFATNSYGIKYYNGCYATSLNNILMSNAVAGVYAGAGDHAYLSNNCFYANTINFNWGGTNYSTMAEINGVANCSNNIVADPLLVSAPTNVHLLNGSPCIGAGMLLSTNIMGSVDYYGQSRFMRTRVEIGCAAWIPPAGTMIYTR